MTRTLVDKIVLGLGACSAFVGAVCVAWALYEEALFLIHGPDGGQDYLISAIAMLCLGAIPSVIASICALLMRGAVSRATSRAFVAPLVLTFVVFAVLLITDEIAYP